MVHAGDRGRVPVRYITATAPSKQRLVSTGITYELAPIFRYYSVVAQFDIVSDTTATRRPAI